MYAHKHRTCFYIVIWSNSAEESGEKFIWSYTGYENKIKLQFSDYFMASKIEYRTTK